MVAGLTLPAQLLTLALHPVGGRMRGVLAYGDFALAGAALEELRQRGAVRLEGRVAIPQADPTGDEVLDALLDKLRSRPDKSWTWHLQHIRLRRLLVHQLETSGDVAHVAARRLGFRIARHVPSEAARSQALGSVRLAAGAGTQRDRALGALAAATLLGSSCIAPDELKSVKRDLQRLVKGDPVAKAIRDIETTWMVASMVPILVVIIML